MVDVDVAVATYVDEFSRALASELAENECQECVGGDVERHSQSKVSGPLVKETRKRVSVDSELAQHVAWWKGHLLYVLGVPSTHDDPARLWIVYDFVDDELDLIEAFGTVVRFGICVFGSEVSPLEAVYWAQVAFFSFRKALLVEELSRAVSVSNVHTLIAQLFRIRFAFQKPQKLLHHSAIENSLRCEQREHKV